ncbi:beta-1,6-galactofuranosyltransferase [Sporolactobacillus pectinivorans]|uniref:beta-1,6-galactofuranosyltransferase n=1 Tax=Sporolactobacillus pectinivorans TaxID=1591408 RepID=UPI0012FE7B4E|nr:beta-1,6-galactofuranosyltransferase [Sporolactobacillus pectinivorans]
MSKYMINVIESEKQHAGSKAKNDINFFLHELGYLNIYIDREVGRVEKYLFAKSSVDKKLSQINDGDMVIVQYPFYMGYWYMKVFISRLRKKNAKTVLILHDVISLRECPDNSKAVKKEIKLLTKFNLIVSHNTKMTQWLKQHGVNLPIINLNLFDYFTPQPIQERKQTKKIVFAGNLNKARFLTLLDGISAEFLLFGPNPSEKMPKNTKYQGSFPPDTLPKYLDGSYGLVWDGDSVRSCGGMFGCYLKYNNPHKISLYLSSGLPVIVWDQSALAPFVCEKQIGLVIGSLQDIGKILETVTLQHYEQMRKNAEELAVKLRDGYFIKKAIRSSEKLLESETRSKDLI